MIKQGLYIEEGVIEWKKSFGDNRLFEARSITQTFDGSYIMAGKSVLGDGSIKPKEYGDWILKLSGNNTFQSDASDAVFSIINPTTNVDQIEDNLDLQLYQN